ncbi:MAG: hypothetical protein JSW59_14665 [Phycisphaerales bacterium]|nr:MAG: hypothetical protein JSW59_14665 [Phycisphaerales bacterium]
MSAKERKLKYVVAIPSVDLPGYVGIDNLLMLGSSDPRYKALKKANPVLSKYLSSFKTPFKNNVNPTIIARDESFSKVDARRLCAFRNAVAVSAVVYSRARSCPPSTTQGVFCTDLFDFHPVSVSSDGTDLIGRTPFELSWWPRAGEFAGQTTLAVIHPETISPSFDSEFMVALLDLIEMRCRTRAMRDFQNRIVRSVEMAYHALRSPSATLGEPIDFGVQIAMWVSAFEILANPRGKDVRFSDVSALIKQVPWRARKLRVKDRASATGSKGVTTLPVQIYGRLYRTRNAYVHGGALRPGEYEYHRRRGWGSLFYQVPVLYRCVLMNILNERVIGKTLADSVEHRAYERALLSRESTEDRT